MSRSIYDEAPELSNSIFAVLHAEPDFAMPIDHTARRAVRLAYRMELMSDLMATATTGEQRSAADRAMRQLQEGLNSVYGSQHAAILAVARPLGEMQQREAQRVMQEYQAAMPEPAEG